MESVWKWCTDTFSNMDRKTVAIGATTIVLVGGILRHRLKAKQRALMKPDYKRDVVYIYSFPRCVRRCGVLHFSPFTLKLETYLRMAKIDYEFIPSFVPSSKGQAPWIELNGQQYADSNMIINMLAKYFNVNTETELTKEQLGTSLAFQVMMDNYFCWTYAYYRYTVKTKEVVDMLFFGNPDDAVPLSLRLTPRFMIERSIHNWVKPKLYAHGIGRHTIDEIVQIGAEEIQAISNYLGEKKFLMGETPSMVDCWMFGHLTQITDCPIDYPFKSLLKSDCRNVVEYVDRIRDMYWPDYDDLFAK